MVETISQKDDRLMDLCADLTCRVDEMLRMERQIFTVEDEAWQALDEAMCEVRDYVVGHIAEVTAWRPHSFRGGRLKACLFMALTDSFDPIPELLELGKSVAQDMLELRILGELETPAKSRPLVLH